MKFQFGLLSVNVSSWGNDMSASMVVASNVHHGSYDPESLKRPSVGYVGIEFMAWGRYLSFWYSDPEGGRFNTR